MKKNTESVNFNKVKTYPLRERENKVKIADFAKGSLKKNGYFKDFLLSLPNAFNAKGLKDVAVAITQARKNGKPVIFCFGANAIERGLSPLIISMMEEDIISSVAINGTGSIYDFEIAFMGATGEDAQSAVQDGTFGMAEETGRWMNESFIEGAKQGLGAGQSLGERILKEDFKFREHSILSKGVELGIPVTVHISVGADIIHQHPICDGAALGEVGYADFQIFTTQISQIGGGGVIVDFSSDALMPEIIQKALAVCRNLGYPVKGFIKADFNAKDTGPRFAGDAESLGGIGYSVFGAHEIMVPLLAWAVAEEL